MELIVLGVSLLLLLLAVASLHRQLRELYQLAKQEQAQLAAILHERQHFVVGFIVAFGQEAGPHLSEHQRAIWHNLEQSSLGLGQRLDAQQRHDLNSEISTRLSLVLTMLTDLGQQQVNERLIEPKQQLAELEERFSYAIQCYNEAAQKFNDAFHHPLALPLARAEGYRSFALF
jgi:hypothetical protein